MTMFYIKTFDQGAEPYGEVVFVPAGEELARYAARRQAEALEELRDEVLEENPNATTVWLDVLAERAAALRGGAK